MRAMQSNVLLLGTSLLALSAGCAPTAIARPELRTTHVTLYDSGLAQIERQADVVGASELEINVETAHLDDVLASLVVATDGGVKVSGVKFPSVQNMGQAVASSGLGNAMVNDSGSLEMPAGLLGYARALVGTSVSITDTTGNVHEGTVLDAVLPSETDSGSAESGEPAEAPEPVVILVGLDGSLSWLPISRVAEITLTSQMEASSVKNFASALSKANGFSQTHLTLETTQDSKGKLAASYIRQMPMWRMLYKVRVEEKKVVLEAWAVVHNDTPEPWQDVTMTLVSGLPKSYVFSVASPRYTHRDVLDAPGAQGEMTPQLGASTADSLLYAWDITRGSYGLGLAGYGAGGGGSGSGFGAGSYGTVGRASVGSTSGEASSSLLQVGESAAEEGMVAQVEAEISTYTTLSTVSLPSGATSLVPLIKRELAGQAFTLLADGMEPSTCVRMENGTGLVLQPGMASFTLDGRFKGQDDIERIEPGELRILCYGEDQDISFTRDVQTDDRHTALEWKGDSLWVHSLRTTTLDYTIENLAGQPRALAVEIHHIANGRVVSPKDVLETDVDTRKLFLLEAPARSENTQRIVLEEGVMTSVYLSAEHLDALVVEARLPDEDLQVLVEARDVLIGKRKLDEDVAAKWKTIAELEASITWQKELLARVPQTEGSSASVDKLLNEILAVKKQLDALKTDAEALGRQADTQLEKAKRVLHAVGSPVRPAG